MITSGNLPFFKNCVYDIQLDIQSPISGFEFSIMETGNDGSFKSANLITFSGKEGFVFDQSGNFFAGYASGVPFDIQIHHDYTNKTFSYYNGGVLIANGLDITGAGIAGLETGKANLIMFTKHGDSSLSITATGAIS
tara:strand:- start:1716 stop:2126 length:411 start_codon:yes stop_codon:yes gene_type:complete